MNLICSGKKKKIAGFLVSFLLFSYVFLLFACGQGDEILLGFSGPLTGKYSDLGVQGRNGATLAVEEINARGGVNGRKLRLISKDDCCSPQEAVKADRELIEKGVAAIIGHMTSGQTMAALPVAEKAGVVMISPTTSTPRLSGKKDMFFRVHASSGLTAAALGRFVSEKLALKTVVTIRDKDNAAFADPFHANFKSAYAGDDTQISSACEYSSAHKDNWRTVQGCVRKHDPDGVLIIASARDTADLIQDLRAAGLDKKFISSGWAATNELLSFGGVSVQGLYLGKTKYPTKKSDAYKTFKTTFEKRFGRKPSFASIGGYNSVRLLFKALKITGGKAQGLPEALVEVEGYSRISVSDRLNEYGDVIAPVSILKVSEGGFTKVDVYDSGEGEWR